MCLLFIFIFIIEYILKFSVGSLSQKITNQLLGLKGLNAQLRDIKKYLIKVRKEVICVNIQFYDEV